MSNYTKATDFAAKDLLASGNAQKAVSGAILDAEFDAMQTSSATKLDKYSSVTAYTTALDADMISIYDTANTAYKRMTFANARIQMTPFLSTGAYATSNSGQTGVGASAWTALEYTGNEYDPGSNYASNTYTVPATGYYLITLRVNGDFSGALTPTEVVYARILEDANIRGLSRVGVRHDDITGIDVWVTSFTKLSSGGAITFQIWHDNTGQTYTPTANGHIAISRVG